jgi:serine/threonine-protein kinase RsbW
MKPSMINIQIESQQMVLESKRTSVNALDKLIADLREIYSISDEFNHDIWVVLNEAVSNAIKHGNKLDPDKKVSLTSEIREDRYLCFVIKDQGRGFNPEMIPDPTHPSRIHNPNGRGIFLMKALSKSVHYFDGGRSVEIVFDLFAH